MAFKVRRKTGVNPMSAIKQVIYLVIALWVGQKIISSIVTSVTQATIDDTNGYFFAGWQFLGLTSGAGSAGVLSIIAVLAVATLVLQFVDISF